MLLAEITEQIGDEEGDTPVAQARQAPRTVPQVHIHPIVVLFSAAIVAAVILFAALNPLGSQGTAAPDAGGLRPELIQAGRDWELQRQQQGGYVDPVLEAAQDWEKQRRQQSGGLR
jgi:hypothetical protein